MKNWGAWIAVAVWVAVIAAAMWARWNATRNEDSNSEE